MQKVKILVGIFFILMDELCIFMKQFHFCVWRNIEPKLLPVEKNDKYEVCDLVLCGKLCIINQLISRPYNFSTYLEARSQGVEILILTMMMMIIALSIL